MYDKADVNLIFEGKKIEEKKGVMQSKKTKFYEHCTQISVTSLSTGLASTINGQKSFLCPCRL